MVHTLHCFHWTKRACDAVLQHYFDLNDGVHMRRKVLHQIGVIVASKLVTMQVSAKRGGDSTAQRFVALNDQEPVSHAFLPLVTNTDTKPEVLIGQESAPKPPTTWETTDVLICNGLGIWVGLQICKRLEMREYKWVSIKDIHSTSGKLKRAVLQFTPGSWTHVRWLDPTCTYMRFFALCQLVIFWQVSELNTFFLKHIFEMPPSHPIVALRLILIGVIVAPSVRQYYSYTTDTQCKRVGTQCWVYGAIMVTEAILCIKNGKELFERTQAVNIIIWFLLQLMLSITCVYGFVLWHKYIQNGDEVSRESSPIKSPEVGSKDHPSGLNKIQEIIGTNIIIPLVTTYHPGLHKLNNLLKTGFSILHSSTTTQHIFKEPPKVTYKQPANLRNLLVKPKLLDLTIQPKQISAKFPYNLTPCKTYTIH
uniref:Phosphatidylserine synthase n=1 Tax=Timema douglasi TaxID=61478 RepID=A0A7R8Z407_TIMDO|nr:unnamed protein product [Timema douglasi]